MHEEEAIVGNQSHFIGKDKRVVSDPWLKLFKYKHVFWKKRLVKKRKESEAKQKEQKKKTREILAEKDKQLMKKVHNSLLKTIIRKHVCKN